MAREIQRGIPLMAEMIYDYATNTIRVESGSLGLGGESLVLYTNSINIQPLNEGGIIFSTAASYFSMIKPLYAEGLHGVGAVSLNGSYWPETRGEPGQILRVMPNGQNLEFVDPPDVAWGEVADKPTTLTGFGITDAAPAEDLSALVTRVEVLESAPSGGVTEEQSILNSMVFS